ncbi:MAG: hypothetical protein AAGD96_02130, partial [Chloroflexota bacterium]
MRSTIHETTPAKSSNFWKKVWIFTFLISVTFLLSIPAVGQEDLPAFLKYREPATNEAGATLEIINQQTGPVVIQPAGSNLALSISPTNGSILAINDLTTGEELSSGSINDALWQIEFGPESEPTFLNAADFTANAPNARFSYAIEPPVLRYEWSQDAQSLTMAIFIQATGDGGLALKPSINNQTNATIETISLPHQLNLPVNPTSQILFPLGEGVLLQPAFFQQARQVDASGVNLFAPIMASESELGGLGLYILQDSLYQAGQIPGHDAAQPVIQPVRFSLTSGNSAGVFQAATDTLIPARSIWEGNTIVLQAGKPIPQLIQSYSQNSRIDQYPTLAEKVAPWGIYHQLATSPIYQLDPNQAIAQDKAPTNQVWQTVAQNWINQLETPGIIHTVNWQQGEPVWPSNAGIWTDRYGSQQALTTMLAELDQNHFMGMATINWSTWNDENLIGTVPTNTVQSNLLIAPWQAQAAHEAVMQFYDSTLPQDFLFEQATQVTQTIGILDDGTPSVTSFHTAHLAESSRLANQKPIITQNGTINRVSYATGIQLPITNEIEALGSMFDTYNPYPLAASLAHTQAAFYTDTNLQTDNPADLSHHLLFGYNLNADLATHINTNQSWLATIGRLQHSVSSRTFGQPLSAFEVLNDENTVIQTAWGGNNQLINIWGNFGEDPFDSGLGYTIAPDGFHAASIDGDVTAGIYEDTFNGQSLSAGAHWVIVDRQPNAIEIFQPYGDSTSLAINRPKSWRNVEQIKLIQVFDGRLGTQTDPIEIKDDLIVFDYNQNLSTLTTSQYILVYTQDVDNQRFEILTDTELEEAIREMNIWRSDFDNPNDWEGATLEVRPDGNFAMLLRESNPNGSTGLIESQPKLFDFSLDLGVKLATTSVPPTATVTVALIDNATEELFPIVSSNSSGIASGRIADFAPWTDARDVSVQIQLDGENAEVGVDFVEIAMDTSLNGQECSVYAHNSVSLVHVSITTT